LSQERDSGAPGGLRRLLREPLLHFMLIGVVIFAGISVAKGLNRPTVRIDAQELEQLASYWELQTQRPPTRAELASIIHERVDEELLAREAVRLGLDKDDMIVRRRLAQKMAFASEDVAAMAEPSDATLQAFYDKTKDRYATPARLALRHIFFSSDRTGVSPENGAEAALAELKAGRPAVGDPSMLPQAYADVAVTDLSRDYGDLFVAAALKAPEGAWVGPVASPYGVHLIRVEKRLAPEIPPLAAVRIDVRAAWLAERRAASNRAFLDKLRRRYKVEIAGLPE
jgi:parvulin-like peptidyl-prolyl isomerase